jgi:hypothetical protein
MGSRVGWVVLAAVVLAGPRPAGGEAEFDFHGLRFGMSSQEASFAAPFVEGQDGQANVLKPGHGMTGLTLVFDRENLLMEIHASYPRPEAALQLEGVRRALRERFLSPVQTAFKDVTVSMDEYANRAALTLVFVSRSRREKSVEYFKAEFLKKIQGVP